MEDWRPLLKRWSEEWIAAHDGDLLDGEVVRDRWLGFGPASPAEVAAAEARLGFALPPSLREFLLVTNGWRDAGNFIYRLAGAAELEWLWNTEQAYLIEAYDWFGRDEHEDEDDGDGYGLLGRLLRVSLAGDAAVMLLDPRDVDEDGEWAAYWLASWSGMGPERYGSFGDLMLHLYAGFHALMKPPGQTRDRWDAEIERARRAALAGEIDGPLAVFEEAEGFGRDRARLLRFQMLAMLGRWQDLPLHHLVLHVDLTDDPLFAAELIPLMFARGRDALGHVVRGGGGSQRARLLVAEHEGRRRDPGFRLPFGNSEFDAAVRGVVERLAAEPAFQVPDPHQGQWRSSGFRVDPDSEIAQVMEARLRLADQAWPQILEAIELWRPVSDEQIAPVVLLAHPITYELITPERGRQILMTPRGDR